MHSVSTSLAIDNAIVPTVEDLPQHLASLLPDQWAVWRSFVLRATGFPLAYLLEFSDEACASAADKLFFGLKNAEARIQAVIDALNRILDRLSKEGKNSAHSRFRHVLHLLHLIRARRLTQFDGLEEECRSAIEEITAAWREEERLHAEFESAFLLSNKRQSELLQRATQNGAFQEAILWQNRHAFETGVKPLLGSAAPGVQRNKKFRQQEELIASYLQRYCAKNDTIGFFGPVAWGRIDSERFVLKLYSGSALVRTRKTYFEDWAIDTLAEFLAKDPETRWWIPPLLGAHLQVQDGQLHAARTAPKALDAFAQRVLPLCNGSRLPSDILILVQQDPEFRGMDKDGLHKFLQQMADAGTIYWRFPVAVEVDAEKKLRSQLLRIPAPLVRQNAVAALDKLENARGNVAAAAGSVESLDSALRNLDRTFEELTGVPARRRHGKTYAARTLVYEDCQRDLTITAGTELLHPIVPAISLLLQSLRWLVCLAGRENRQLVRRAYDELIDQNSGREISAAALAVQCGLKAAQVPPLKALKELFRNKWAQLLPVSSEQSVVQFKSEHLRDAVAEAFPESGPAKEVQPIRYYCPDLMIEASDIESIQQGKALYILGELHVAKNTLATSLFVQQHPSPQELIDSVSWDCQRRFRLLNAGSWNRLTGRLSDGIYCPTDYFLGTGLGSTAPMSFKTNPISELLVRERNSQLFVVTPDGLWFDVLEAYADLFTWSVIDQGRWISPSSHTPRVVIDNLVIQREEWMVAANILSFANEKQEHLRFLGARKWMKDLKLPNRVFVKIQGERKPFYLDFSASVYVEHFCKMVRRTAGSADQTVLLSEMLPRPEGLWLSDASGARYTAELRFTFVDLQARKGPAEKKQER